MALTPNPSAEFEPTTPGDVAHQGDHDQLHPLLQPALDAAVGDMFRRGSGGALVAMAAAAARTHIGAEPTQLIPGDNPNGWTASTAGTAFPLPAVRFSVTSAAGWPANGMVSVRRTSANSRITQTLEHANNNRIDRRAWDNTTSQWRAWEIVASQAHVTAALAPVIADVAAHKTAADAINARVFAAAQTRSVYDGVRKADIPSIASTDSGHTYHRLGSWGRASNRIVNPLGGNDRKLVVDAGTSGEMVALIDLAAGGSFGISFRGSADDVQHQLAVRLVAAGALELRRCVGAARDTLKTVELPATTGLHTLAVWSRANDVLVRLDGVAQMIFTLDPGDVTEFAGTGWGLYCHNDPDSSCLGWTWMQKRGLKAAIQGLQASVDSGGGGSAMGWPPFTYGLLADRGEPDPAGRQYLAVDVDGGTLYGSTGETWLQLAKGVNA